jgi:signal transduction histidine kinase
LHLAVAERLSQAVDKTRQIEQLRAANRAYNEILGFVAHELKSPVASMVMNGGLLRDGVVGPMSEKQVQLVQRIISSGEYLLRLTEEYLDLARMESGEIELQATKDVDFFETVVEPSLDVIQVQREAKQMRLVTAHGDGPVTVEVDPGLLKIVMVNLLSNAVKYGRSGGEIRLNAKLGEARLVVSVRNEGPGFPKIEQPRLFRRFSRLRSPELAKEKGTGIGLYTVWRIVRLHGGRIEARSEPEQWAEFEFEIPQPLPPRA